MIRVRVAESARDTSHDCESYQQLNDVQSAGDARVGFATTKAKGAASMMRPDFVLLAFVVPDDSVLHSFSPL